MVVQRGQGHADAGIAGLVDPVHRDGRLPQPAEQMFGARLRRPAAVQVGRQNGGGTRTATPPA